MEPEQDLNPFLGHESFINVFFSKLSGFLENAPLSRGVFC